MNHIDLDTVTLERGGHSPDSRYCVMELTAALAEEGWTDHPETASTVIGAFLRSWNDSLDDNTRQLLKPYAAKVIGTRGTKKQEETRAWMATDWLARECAPAFLRLAGLTEHAEVLEALAPLASSAVARKAQPKLAAARDAAGSAARAAAGAAARAAARDAAGSAARDAAGAAARAAARDAAGAAAWAAAGAAARAALAPTVKMLQTSAFGLLDRMIEVGA